MRSVRGTQAGTGTAPLLVRAALALYPPAWRARYGNEVLALLEESGGGLRTAAGLAWRALPVWLWPPRHLHDRHDRMRVSVATVLVAWSVLAGLGLAFAQLTQQQGFRPPGYPVVGWSYTVFDVGLAVSALIMTGGGLPLWLLMLRRARREHSARYTTYLVMPVAAPLAYLIILIAGLKLIGHSGGIGPWWFMVFTVLGLAAAGLAAAGPGLALRRLRPRGPAVRLAAIAAALAVGAIVLAAAASSMVAVGLYLWSRDYAGYHDAVPLGTYLALLGAPAVVATVTAARGGRAALAR